MGSNGTNMLAFLYFDFFEGGRWGGNQNNTEQFHYLRTLCPQNNITGVLGFTERKEK